MASTGKKWLLGCGIGCGSIVLIGIILSVVGTMMMTRPMDEAASSQQTLTERFGERDGYVPPARLTADRIEAFLAVREQLLPRCAEFRAITARFEAMDEMESAGDDPSPGEIFRNVKGVMGAAFGLAGSMGGLVRDRNDALYEQGMGLGEYTWIYVLSYHSLLGNPTNVGLDSKEGRPFSSKQRRRIIDMMERHADALETEGELDLAAQWRDEAGNLERRDDGVPFAHGELPADFAEAVAPYRDALERTWCGALAEFELGEIEKDGMSYHAR